MSTERQTDSPPRQTHPRLLTHCLKQHERVGTQYLRKRKRNWTEQDTNDPDTATEARLDLASNGCQIVERKNGKDKDREVRGSERKESSKVNYPESS